MPETRKIRVKGKEIVFLLTFKDVKNLNLRIRKNGSVAVSAPRRTPLYRIDDFVRANAELIVKHTERAKEYNTIRVLRPGDTVFFLGDSYRLCFPFLTGARTCPYRPMRAIWKGRISLCSVN